MRKIVVVVVGLMLAGCCCKRCWGQEVKPEVAKPVVMTSTQVTQWKADLFDGLNKINTNPYGTVADLLLVNGFGLSRVPRGKETAEVSQENFDKMTKVIRSIKAMLGFAIIQQATVLQENKEAVQAAIDSATDTIKDTKTREAFLLKANLLNKD